MHFWMIHIQYVEYGGLIGQSWRTVIIKQQQQTNRNMQNNTHASHKPIIIDNFIIDQDDAVSYDGQVVSSNVNKQQYGKTSRISGKPKLNQIIPELPQFGIKNNCTSLLYSKFIVKGLKQDKIGLLRNIMSATKMQKVPQKQYTQKDNMSRIDRKTDKCEITLDKQDKTEAETFNKNKSKSVRSITKTKSPQIPTVYQEQNLQLWTENTQFTKMNRASSAKVFNNLQARGLSIVANQSKRLKKNQTQLNLHFSEKKRPVTAVNTKRELFRYSCGEDARGQNERANNLRPSTAKLRQANNQKNNLYSTQQLQQLVHLKIGQKPLKIHNWQAVNYIDKNIQNISSYSRKSSIYLTNALSTDRLMKSKQTKPRESVNDEPMVSSTKAVEQFQLKPQQVFVKADQKMHECKRKQVESYLQSVSPVKYHEAVQTIRKLQKINNPLVIQDYQQLISKDLDNGFADSHFEINERSAKACFQDYIQNCQILQYNISSNLKTEQSNTGNAPTLNICECQQIITIFRSMEKQTSPETQKSMIDAIRKITANLKYFSHKPKQQIDNFFLIPFGLEIVNENTTIIELNSSISYIYIILNGSVLVETSTSQQNMQISSGLEGQFVFSQHSLYDGESFGEPSQPSEKRYKCRITALEQSLLLKVKYQDYAAKFFVGSEIQQKLSLLSLIFKSELNRSMIQQEDLQILSLSLQKFSFPSKSLIFREGEVFDKLIFVAKGKLVPISQFILKQAKVKPSDMKELDKNIRESKQEKKQQQKSKKHIKTHQNVQKLNIRNMRRQNLINFQILKQNDNEIQFYYMKEYEGFVRGDTDNWEPIFTSVASPTAKNFLQQSMNAIIQFGLFTTIKPKKYSLMSNSDETVVYFLSRNAFQYLPNHLKKLMLAKGTDRCKKQIKIESAHELKQWNNYKKKLCNNIAADKRIKSAKRL